MIHVVGTADLKPHGFDELRDELMAGFETQQKQDGKLTMPKYWTSVRPRLHAAAEALASAFNGKCAYCEAKMSHVSAPQIEHYRPKSRGEFASLAFEWSNWLLSCGRCNQSKWAHFPSCSDTPCLLNPTVDQPADHLSFVREHVVKITVRGFKTIELLRLDRGPLEDERAMWLMQVDALLLLCLNQDTKPQARRLLLWSTQDNAPYAAMTRSYLSSVAPLLANPAEPHPVVEIDDARGEIVRLLDENANAIATMT